MQEDKAQTPPEKEDDDAEDFTFEGDDSADWEMEDEEQ